MKRPVRGCALSALGLGILLSSGCGSSTTNEEGLVKATGAANDPNIPVFKTYGERVLYEKEQADKKRAAEKGKPAPKKETKAATEPPKTEPPKAQ